MRSGIEMDVLERGNKDFCLIDTDDYDFIFNSIKPAMAQDIIDQVRPFAKTILDRTTNYVGLYQKKKIVYIDKNKIIGIEVMERDCYVYTKKFMYRISRYTLCRLLSTLNDPNIIRCHKSFAVNVKYVKSFRRETSNRWRANFIVDTRFDCRISETYIKSVRRQYEKYNSTHTSHTLDKELLCLYAAILRWSHY